MGIDPDLIKSGVGVWDATRKNLIYCGSCDFFKVIEWIDSVSKEGGTIVIEAGWLNKKSNFHKAQGPGIREKIAKNVGECAAVGKLLVQYCEIKKVEHRIVKPTRSKEVSNLIFKQTGWQERTNQDARDAAALVIGL